MPPSNPKKKAQEHKLPATNLLQKPFKKKEAPKIKKRDGEDKVLAWSSRQKYTKTPSINKSKTQKQKKEDNKKTLTEREQQKP